MRPSERASWWGDRPYLNGYIVTPHTILRGYRQLVAQKYDGSKYRRPVRPRTADELRALLVLILGASERLRDALRTLGHEIGRTTIQGVLKEQGPSPAPGIMQAIRNLLDVEDGSFTGKTKLITDRDPAFPADV